MRKHWLLLPVLLGYLLLGTLYAVYTPDWQAPDEPAHYNYVRQLATGTFPVMEPGDYDQTYIETIVSSRFDPALPVAPITYEDWQPPLYYLLQTPGYLATGGSLTALRLLSVLFGAGVVVLAYFIGLTLSPERPWIGLGAAVFVAFLPQHLAMMASVNNDSLAELLIAAVLFLLVRPWPDAAERLPVARLLGLGLLLGAGFLTKGTAYLLAPVVGLVLLYRYWGRWRPLVQAGLLVFGVAALLGSIWWLRNAAVYGDFDILIRQTHDEVVVGQPRTEEWIAQFGLAETMRRFFETTFNSFWGQFGWMAAPLPGWAYLGLRLLALAALAGLVVAALAWWGRRRGGSVALGPNVGLSLIALLSMTTLTAALHAGYNLTFVQHQGRYLFPALIPIGLGLSAGLGVWLAPAIRRWPNAGYLVPTGLALVLVPLALFSLFRVIVPFLGYP